MTRSPPARLVAFVLALLAGFGPGALALAHGHAHEHLAEARAGTHVGPAASHAHGAAAHHAAERPSVPERAVLDRDGQDDDHGHPRLDASVSGRVDLRLDFGLGLPAPAVATFGLLAVQSRAIQLLTAAPPRAGPTHGPPPPSRAPPLG